MFIGLFLFAAIAVVCVVAGLTVMKRSRDYGKGDEGDDFDFDAYEGFDK